MGKTERYLKRAADLEAVVDMLDDPIARTIMVAFIRALQEAAAEAESATSSPPMSLIGKGLRP